MTATFGAILTWPSQLVVVFAVGAVCGFVGSVWLLPVAPVGGLLLLVADAVAHGQWPLALLVGVMMFLSGCLGVACGGWVRRGLREQPTDHDASPPRT